MLSAEKGGNAVSFGGIFPVHNCHVDGISAFELGQLFLKNSQPDLPTTSPTANIFKAVRLPKKCADALIISQYIIITHLH